MRKRALMVTLSMALLVGLAGIVNAATTGSNITDTSSQPSNASAYVNHNNGTSMAAVQGTASQTDQTQPSQADQTSTTQTDIYTPMSSNVSMNNRGQNILLNNQIQTMPMSSPINGQMSNSQSKQGMSVTDRNNQASTPSTTQPSGQNSSVNTMMGFMGRMGR